MQFAERVLQRTAVLLLIASCLVVSDLGASTVRVTTLGGDSRLLLDSTNLFHYPALARQLAHANVELFDDWGGIAAPIGDRHGVALFLRRPEAGQQRLSTYLQGTGSRLLRSLRPTAPFDGIYAWQARPGLSLGMGLRYDYDVRDRGDDEAAVSRWDGRFGIALGRQHRRLDATVALQRVSLRDRSANTTRTESGGNGFSVDLRARVPVGADAILLPSVLWQRSDLGLQPETHEQEHLRGAVSLNVRPVPTVLGVVGIVVGGSWTRTDDLEDGLGPTERRRWLVPAIVAGGEMQAGSLLFRLGLRHESVVDELESPAGVDLSFDTAFVTHVGVGLEFGHLVVDGVLEKNFLRDGPHFIGGSARGGGLVSTLSMMYRFYQ